MVKLKKKYLFLFYKINLEIEISVREARKRKDFEFLKKLMDDIKLSFYAYWITKEIDCEKKLQEFFGLKRVFSCLNRIDCQVKNCPVELSKEILFKNVTNGKNWIDIENLLGCLINDIDL